MGLKHQAASARKWRAAIRQVETHFPADLPPILFLTDPDRVPKPIEAIPRLPKGSAVIYRHFGASNRRSMAIDMRAVCIENDHRFLVSADPELALESKADGVHWPEARLRTSWQWRGQFALQTASAHSLTAIRRAQKAGMDAALFSAVYPSTSASAGVPIGPVRLRAAKRQTDIPLYALGGITAWNAGRVARVCGLAGVQGLI
ncbi:MAG: thiamine phosphate synthase [Pseudomonadota bacterium]